MIGKSEADLYDQQFAAMYHRDELAVINGRAILDKPELIQTAPGEFEWRLTSKIPVRDAAGRIVGTAGITRRMTSAATMPGQPDALGGLIRHARENIARRITVRGLATHAKLSVATLKRRIQTAFVTTPRRFLAVIRLNEAARLLSGSAMNVAEVADRSGYESPASITRALRRPARGGVGRVPQAGEPV